MTEKKKAVGVQLLARTQTGELVALLQIRPDYNEEKQGPETWRGACQNTTQGGLKPGEDFMTALWREIGEELNEKIVPIIQDLHSAGKLIELVNFNTSPKIQVVTFGAIVGEDVWKFLLAKPKNRSFAGFKVVRQHEVAQIVDLEKTYQKETGVTDDGVVAMFSPNKDALVQAFLKLG